MVRTKTNISTDEKIEQQKQVVSKAKDRYDSAVEVLEQLMRKRDEIRNRKLIEAISSSSRTYDEIMEFLQGKSPEECLYFSTRVNFSRSSHLC